MKSFRVLIIVLSVLTTRFSFTQDYFVVMNTNASTGITFQQNEGTSVRVFPGMQLAKTGSLYLEAGKSVGLVYDKQKVTVTGPRQLQLASLVVEQQEETSFLGRFWDFVSTSVSKTENPQEMENYHEKYMTNSVAGIKGFGDKAFAISIPMQFTETLSSEYLDLHWACKDTTVSTFAITITSEDDQVVIMNMLTNRADVKLPLNALALDTDKIYRLRVAILENEAVSPEILFSYEPLMVNNYLQELSNEQEYQKLEAEEQLLYLAWELEKERYFNAAYEQYQTLLASAPDNVLYQKVFAAFLVRMNDLATAQAIIQ